MILIKKNQEPSKWLAYRLTQGVDYQAIPELVESLLKEQGYICAYCMRRIPHKDRLYVKKSNEYVLTNEDHRVEHIKSREKHDDLKFDYSNLVICCPGHIGDEDHCDRLKKSQDISFSPLDPVFINSISYTSEGKIVSSNDVYNNEMEKVLNLNTRLLVLNRKSALDGVIKNINVVCKRNGKWDKPTLNKIIDKYKNMHIEDGDKKFYPYCGIILNYLCKKVSQL